MTTTPSSDWQELASRNNDGLAISLLWNRHGGRVKVSVADSSCDEEFEFDVPAELARAAFQHPFAFAADRGVRFGDALRESTDLQPQR